MSYPYHGSDCPLSIHPIKITSVFSNANVFVFFPTKRSQSKQVSRWMTRKSKIECFCERTHSMQQCLSSAVFPLKGNQPSTYVPHTHSPSFRTFSLRHRNKDCVGRDWNLPDKRRPFPHDLVLLCMPRISRSSGLSFFRSRLSSFIIFPGTKFSSNWALLGSLIFRKLQWELDGSSSWPIFFSTTIRLRVGLFTKWNVYRRKNFDKFFLRRI